jgi:hypothetical protein
MAPNIAKAGKRRYGAPAGILMLEARFPRVPGDMGNGATWPFPVLYGVVRGASPTCGAERNAESLLDAFIEAARDLADLGAEAITTHCGFLSLVQRAAPAAVPRLISRSAARRTARAA